MIKNTYFCDGCSDELDVDAYSQGLVHSNNFIQQHPEFQKVVSEVFCPTCSEISEEYWQQKLDLNQKIASENETRISRHRNKYFQTNVGKASSK